MTLLQRRPDLGPAAFSAYWRTRHRDVVLAVPGIRVRVASWTHAVAAMTLVSICGLNWGMRLDDAASVLPHRLRCA